MNNLPNNWVSCSLEDLLITLESGSRPKGGVKGISDGTPSIGGEHLTYQGTFNWSSVRYVPEKFSDSMNKGKIKTNDILIVKDGATTGKTAFVDEHFPFPKAVVNEHIFICRPSDLINPKFLFRYLTSKDGQERILDNFKGSAQGGINLTFAPNTEVLLAPLNEQRRIVEKLEKLLAKVNTCKQRLDKIPNILKRFRQSVLAAACSGRLTADWRENNPDVEPASELLKRIQKERYIKYQGRYREALLAPHESLPEISQNWCSATLDQLSIFVTSGSRGWAQYYSDTGAIFIRAQDINTDQLKLSEVAYVNLKENTEGTRSRVKFGDLLITATGANVAKTALVDVELPEAYVSQHIGLVRLVNIECCQFIYYWIISSSHGRSQLLDAAYGAGKPGLNLDNIRELIIALPPLEEQQEIVNRVQTLFKLADQIEQRYQKAKNHVDQLTQSILAKAFRGELVPQDPNDEPASVLLERIRAERAKLETETKTAKKSTGQKGKRRSKKDDVASVPLEHTPIPQKQGKTETAQKLTKQEEQQDLEPIQLELPLY